MDSEKKRYLRPKFSRDKSGNPFINPTFRIPVNEILSNRGLLKQIGDKTVSAEEYIYKDTHKFIKLYTDLTIDDEDDEGKRVVLSKLQTPSLRKDKAKLSGRAIHLLAWIAEEIKTGDDFVQINKARYLAEGSISSVNTYKAAIKELIDANFIAASSVKDTYFINPLYMFKGDRAKKYPNHVDIVYTEKKNEKVS